MSDFDREAERERLREKYERDEERRASTQRMSDLLLKGATMTNRHCDACGDPIFEYDDRAFCPTCQGADGAAQESGTSEGSGQESGPPTGGAGGPAGTADEGVATGNGTARDGTTKDGAAAGEGTATDRPESTRTADEGGPAGHAESDDRPDEPPGRAASSGADGDRTTARSTLERTVARFATRAEATDDPHEARDLLAAAREAAEALAALEGRHD